MNYIDLIKEAFWITLRNRYLWFFGFFAGLGGGGGGGGWGGGGGSDFDGEGQRQASADPLFAAQQTAFDNLALIAVLVVVGLLVLLVLIVLNLISQGALAESVAAEDRGEHRRFSSAWRAGTSNFWPVLGQVLLFILIGAGLLLLIGLPVAALIYGASVADSTALWILVVLVALIALLLLIAVFISLAVVSQFALRGLVVGRRRVFDSIGGGYRLFRQNLGRSLLVWLIQAVLMFAAGIVLLIAAVIVGLVLFIPAIILFAVEYVTVGIVASVVAALILTPIFIVALAILGTFNHSYWTLAYLRLTGPAEEPAPQPG